MWVTGVKGRVTYANVVFVSVIGFLCDEIMGQPHNLVRHPDIPKEAFVGLWKTPQDGESWSALVKNRCKTGDHYWVRAKAAPMCFDN